MTSIEDRLVADVAAVNRGVVVTESDLASARYAVQERAREPRLRRGPVVAAAAAAALVLVAVGVTASQVLDGDGERALVAVAPAPTTGPDADYLTGAALTRDLIEGVWRVDNGTSLLAFGADGVVRFDNRGTLLSNPTTTGTYALEGQTITVTVTADQEPQCVGASFAMRASVFSPGVVRFVRGPGSESCGAIPPGRGALEQLLPTASPEVASLDFSRDVGWRPVKTAGDLHGMWVTEGGGHLVELAPGGSYVVAAGSGPPVDQGSWSLRGSELVLTSEAGSTRCDTGDRLVRSPLESVFSGAMAIRGAVTGDACGGPWSAATWLLLPDSYRA